MKKLATRAISAGPLLVAQRHLANGYMLQQAAASSVLLMKRAWGLEQVEPKNKLAIAVCNMRIAVVCLYDDLF